jgi:hypothetical protein
MKMLVLPPDESDVDDPYQFLSIPPKIAHRLNPPLTIQAAKIARQVFPCASDLRAA